MNNFNLDKLLRPNVKTLAPYSSARDEFSGNDGVFLDANENPYGLLNRYPDPYQRQLKEAIAKVKHVATENIFLGNGSDEVIDICFRTFCTPGVDKAISFTPTYGMYQVSASINDVEMIAIPLDRNFEINYNDLEPYLGDKKIKLLFICSPNNPSGNCINQDTILKIINTFEGMVIIDEAYIDFADRPSLNQQLDKYPNLIVLQTFSKAFGLASIRVGMAFTSAAVISYFNKMKPPYNISKLNQQAALDRLLNMDNFNSQVATILAERERVTKELNKIGIVNKTYASDANFVLAETIDATAVYNYLVERKVIVRNRHSVVKNCIRITIGTPDENDNLIAALNCMADSYHEHIN